MRYAGKNVGAGRYLEATLLEQVFEPYWCARRLVNGR